MTKLAENRKARFDYDIKDTFDAGLVLTGGEVKSAKAGSISLTGSYVTVSPKGATLIGAHIGAYKYAKVENYNPTRNRQLLLKKEELHKLLGKEKGFTIVPLEIYSGKRGLVKLSLGLGRGRKKTDKREYIKKREINKEIRQSI